MFNGKKAGLSKSQLSELGKLEAEEQIVKELLIYYNREKIDWSIRILDDKIEELLVKKQDVIATRRNKSDDETKILTIRQNSIQAKMKALHDGNKLLARLRMLKRETIEIERVLEVEHGVLETTQG